MIDTPPMRARLRQTLRLFDIPTETRSDRAGSRSSAAARAVEGLWRRDPAVWSGDPTVQAAVAKRLGWLRAPAEMIESVDRIRAFAARIKEDRFSDVVLLGMGGSSLAPE